MIQKSGICRFPRWTGLPWWLSGKEPTCSARDTGSIPGWGRSPGGVNGNSFQYSCLENPMDRRAWRARAHAICKVSDTTEQACTLLPRWRACRLCLEETAESHRTYSFLKSAQHSGQETKAQSDDPDQVELPEAPPWCGVSVKSIHHTETYSEDALGGGGWMGGERTPGEQEPQGEALQTHMWS